MKPLPGGGN